jgi:hypothetical protein
MAVLDLQWDAVGFEELKEVIGQTEEVLMRVVLYSQPIREVQRVCDHPQQIIDLQRQVMDLQTKQFLPPRCDHTE